MGSASTRGTSNAIHRSARVFTRRRAGAGRHAHNRHRHTHADQTQMQEWGRTRIATTLLDGPRELGGLLLRVWPHDLVLTYAQVGASTKGSDQSGRDKVGTRTLGGNRATVGRTALSKHCRLQQIPPGHIREECSVSRSGAPWRMAPKRVLAAVLLLLKLGCPCGMGWASEVPQRNLRIRFLTKSRAQMKEHRPNPRPDWPSGAPGGSERGHMAEGGMVI